jgi:effector-binding domain-containing protein
MATCEAGHAEFEKQADGKVHVGTLPEWTRVKGKVAYRVHRGPYSELHRVSGTFPEQVLRAKESPAGPSGDVYVCPSMDHPGGDAKLLTVLYFPVK